MECLHQEKERLHREKELLHQENDRLKSRLPQVAKSQVAAWAGIVIDIQQRDLEKSLPESLLNPIK